MSPGRRTLAGAPDGVDALAIAKAGAEGPVVAVYRDEPRMRQATERLAFVAPDLPIIPLPAWDCLPYDRVSPNADSIAGRLDALSVLCGEAAGPVVILTTVSAILQKVPPAETFRSATLRAVPGDRCSLATLQTFFERNGYRRATTVREPGEYAVRGGSSMSIPRARRIHCVWISSATSWRRSAVSTP